MVVFGSNSEPTDPQLACIGQRFSMKLELSRTRVLFNASPLRRSLSRRRWSKRGTGMSYC
jgi:hypothetical protein